MPIGKSNEHLAFPGTLSLSAATLTALWTDIGQSVANAGVRKLVLFNSHGGQPQVRIILLLWFRSLALSSAGSCFALASKCTSTVRS